MQLAGEVIFWNLILEKLKKINFKKIILKGIGIESVYVKKNMIFVNDIKQYANISALPSTVICGVMFPSLVGQYSELLMTLQP